MMFQMLNRSGAVDWLLVVQQSILMFAKYTIYEIILIISKHQSTTYLSIVLSNLYTEMLSKVGNPKRFWYVCK